MMSVKLNSKSFFSSVTIVLLSFSLSGCSTYASNSSLENQSTNSTVNRAESNLKYSQIIDVRTLEEWNTGHLEGAVRIGIEDPNFVKEISSLNQSSNYYIYCRSGNRAEQAIQLMRDSGFTGNLVNGGSVAEASKELNLEIIN